MAFQIKDSSVVRTVPPDPFYIKEGFIPEQGVTGPRGEGAWAYAVRVEGYTGTEAEYYAEIESNRQLAEAARIGAEEADGLAEISRNEAIWAADGAVIAKDAAVLAKESAINEANKAALSAISAKESEDASGLSETATGEDRVQTGLDRTATGGDRTQTGLDRIATAADKVATNADVLLTHADVLTTGLDKTATGLDRTQTGLDAIATAADRVQTGQDKAATALDKIATNADVVLTHADVVTTGQDRAAMSVSLNTLEIPYAFIADDTFLITGDSQITIHVTENLAGKYMVKANAAVSTPSSSGIPTFNLRNVTQGNVDILSTPITVPINQYDSFSATQSAINPTYKLLTLGDRIAVDCDIAGTGTKGCCLILKVSNA